MVRTVPVSHWPLAARTEYFYAASPTQVMRAACVWLESQTADVETLVLYPESDGYAVLVLLSDPDEA